MAGLSGGNAGPLTEETITSFVAQLRADPDVRARFTDALRQNFVATAEQTFDLTPAQQEALRRLTSVPQDALALFIHTIALSLELGQESMIELPTTTATGTPEQTPRRRKVRASCDASGEAEGNIRWMCNTVVAFEWE